MRRLLWHVCNFAICGACSAQPDARHASGLLREAARRDVIGCYSMTSLPSIPAESIYLKREIAILAAFELDSAGGVAHRMPAVFHLVHVDTRALNAVPGVRSNMQRLNVVWSADALTDSLTIAAQLPSGFNTLTARVSRKFWGSLAGTLRISGEGIVISKADAQRLERDLGAAKWKRVSCQNLTLNRGSD